MTAAVTMAFADAINHYRTLNARSLCRKLIEVKMHGCFWQGKATSQASLAYGILWSKLRDKLQPCPLAR